MLGRADTSLTYFLKILNAEMVFLTGEVPNSGEKGSRRDKCLSDAARVCGRDDTDFGYQALLRCKCVGGMAPSMGSVYLPKIAIRLDVGAGLLLTVSVLPAHAEKRAQCLQIAVVECTRTRTFFLRAHIVTHGPF